MDKSPALTEKITLSGIEYSGVLLHRVTGSRNVLRLFSGTGNNGWIVRGGEVENWKILGFTEFQAANYLYGPRIEAVPFFETLAFEDEKNGLLDLEVLAESLSVLETKNIFFSRLFPEGIFFLPRGGILFLPEQVMEKALLLRSEAERLAGYEILNHPDLAGKENFSFAFGCLSYRILAGKYPFQGESEETLHTDMRMNTPLSMKHERPEIKNEISDFVSRALVSRNARPSFEEWAKELRRTVHEGWVEPIGEEDKRLLLADARRLRNKTATEGRRRDFWRKNRFPVILTVSIILAAAYFIGGTVSNLLKPPVTRGFSPSAVVELFYRSIGAFDHAAMEDCVSGDAGKSYIREATHLFVISRMRMSVEMTEPFVNADVWDQAGRPALPPGKTLYGITGLSLKETVDPSGAFVFTVNFERWVPEGGDSAEKLRETGAPKSTGLHISENVRVERQKKDWRISRIERISETPLPDLPE
jgi:hypothetical protein